MGRVDTGLRDMSWDDNGVPRLVSFVTIEDASKDAVEIVLGASEDDEFDGRSQWVWLTFPNGDLALAVFPQGGTYFDVEEDRVKGKEV